MDLIKIAIFADFPLDVLKHSMVGRGGGHAATWLPQLGKAWEMQKNFEIHWCVLDRTTRRIETIRHWNQYFHKLPCPSITLSLLLHRWPQSYIFRKIINHIKPHLIQCWGTETLNGVALRDFNGPSILSMQGIMNAYFVTGDLQGWRWRLFRHWEKSSIQKASVISCESKWGLDQVSRIVPNKTQRQIEYGVYPSFYEVIWNPDPNKPRILFVGGLNRLKGVDILLNMLRKHRSKNWTMVFVGGGYLADELRNLNDCQIEVLGMLKSPEVQAEMARAWALVMPSRADTSPNVVKEARVIGLPVIGSPQGGHAEYIHHGEDGLIVDTEDPDQWFESIHQTVSSYDNCLAMGKKRHAWFRDHFRPEKTATAFLDLYRELTSK